jgi:small subunit ribosomal protein S6
LLRQKSEAGKPKGGKTLANRVYEMMYIAKPETAADDIAKLNEGITKVIETEGGSVVKLEDMGKRKLAYEIKRMREGHYVLFEIEGSGKEIAELERRMRVNDLIVRFITVRVDEDRKAAEKIRAKREKRQARRNSGFKRDEKVDEASTQVQAN